MTEIYYGRSLQNTYQAIAHDLGGMRVALHLALGPKDRAVRDRYVREVSSREKALALLADQFSAPAMRHKQTDVLRYTNQLLYEIHLLVQLPLWQYVVKKYPQVDVITAVRTSERQP